MMDWHERNCRMACRALAFFFFAGISPVFSATYYVSVADGNDTNCTGLGSSAYTGGSNQPSYQVLVAQERNVNRFR